MNSISFTISSACVKTWVVTLLLIHFGSNLKAQTTDIELLEKINLNRNKNLDPLWSGLSYSVTPSIILFPATMIIYQLKTKDSAQAYKTKLVCGTVIISAVIATSLKYSIQRPRPYITYSNLDENTESTSPSFPSGHTSAAFSLATSLSVAYPKWYVIVPAYTWASGAAYSRLTLGAHYPSDVLAGAIIGSGSAWLSLKLNHWINKRSSKKRPNEN
jgi:membrane-associated phospholipid phosphatase